MKLCELRKQMKDSPSQKYRVLLDKGGNEFGLVEDTRSYTRKSQCDDLEVEYYCLKNGVWEVWV